MNRLIASFFACLCASLLAWSIFPSLQTSNPLAGSLLESTAIAQAPASNPLTSQFLQLAQQSPPLAPATYTFTLRDLDTGSILASHNGDNSMVPASTHKLLATSFAASQFPLNHRWSTQLISPSTGSTVPQLVLVGSGDPTLGSPQISGNPTFEAILNDMVSSVRSAGITSVGELVGNTAAISLEPIPRSWTYDDFGNYFGAPVSALSVHDNLYRLNFRPSSVGQLATVTSTEPPMPWLTFHNDMRTGPAGSGDNGYIFGVPEQNDRWLRGTVPAGNSFFIYGAMPDPADAFLRILRSRLEAAGISVGNIRQDSSAPPTGTILWQQQSPTLQQIIHFTNHTSFNLYADGLFALAAQKAAGATPVTNWHQATDLELAWLRGLGISPTGLRLEDGSGLSRRNLVTADGMTALLVGDHRQAWWPQFYQSMPTVDSPGRPTGVVRGKSGFIAGVRTLSGVITTQGDHQLAFSVLVNHYNGTIAQADQFIGQFLDQVWQQD